MMISPEAPMTHEDLEQMLTLIERERDKRLGELDFDPDGYSPEVSKMLAAFDAAIVVGLIGLA